MQAIGRALILASFGIVWPILGLANPEITGIKGSPADGRRIEITGTGFGTHELSRVLAVPDAYVVEAETLQVQAPGVLTNDRDSNGYPLSAQPVSGPAHGLLRLALDGSFLYVPNPAFKGTDAFTYAANNGHGDMAMAMVRLVVHGQSQPLFQGAQSGGSSASRTVTTTSSVGGSPGNLHLVVLATKPFVTATAVAGLGTNWTLVGAQCSGRGQTGVEIWIGRHATHAGTVTASFATLPRSAVIVACEYTGVDPDNPVGEIVSGNTNGRRGTCEGGVDGTSYDLDLEPKVPGSVILGAVAMRNRTQSPGPPYKERAWARAGASGDQVSVDVVDRVAQGPVSIDGTFSGTTDWAVIGIELRPAVQTPSHNPGQKDPENVAAKALPPLRELRIFPNPVRDGAEIVFDLAKTATIRMEIHDAAGRRIRILLHGSQPPGVRLAVWDGRDDAGHRVPSGVYFVRFTEGSRQLSRKLVVQR